MFPMPFANGTGPSSSTRCVDLDGEPNPNSLPTHGWVARVVASGLALDRKVGRRTSSWPETREHPRAHLKSLRRHFLLAPRLNSMHDARVRNPELCDQCPHEHLMNASWRIFVSEIMTTCFFCITCCVHITVRRTLEYQGARAPLPAAGGCMQCVVSFAFQRKAHFRYASVVSFWNRVQYLK